MPATTTPRERTPEEGAIAASLAAGASATVRAINLLGRLIDAEDANLTALDALEADAKRALVDPPSLEAARQAGQDLDDCKAERAAIVPCVIALANTCDRSTRGLRHTASLQSRLISGRPFTPLPPLAPPPGDTPGDDPSRPPPHSAPRARREGDTESTERPDLYDTPERFGIEHPGTGDEPAPTTLEAAAQAVHRSLSQAAATAARLAPGPDNPAQSRTPPPGWQYEPGVIPFTLSSPGPATRPRKPDT